ncbi:sigma-70 family RNA polymerase sigma factor [bacterium]|nr:sigma-70 family RNA polymerase sigma factor [bacterium]
MANPDPSQDLQLIKEFQAGREQAFNELVLRHRRGVFVTAAGMLGNDQDADDVAQEVFIKVYTALQDFRGESAFYTWLYRITVNLCLNRLRSRKTRSFFGLDAIEQIMPSSESADRGAEASELQKLARKAISELPEKQRIVFILRHFHELPHAEIARIVDREVGTIKANYFQAIRKLRESLGPYFEGKE